MSAARRSQQSTAPRPASPRVSRKEYDRLRDGFSAISEAKIPFQRLHCHDDIELGINESAPLVALFGTDRVVLPPDYLIVFWANRPHGPIETTPGGWAHAIHIPLPWVLQWRLPGSLMKPLLAGQVLLGRANPELAADLELVKNWVRLMQQGGEEGRRIVLLEAEARLRRMALELATQDNHQPVPATPAPDSPGRLGRFERMAALLATHFREPLAIEDIAEAVGIGPTSAMRLFRKVSGMTIHEYLVQQRVSHAQFLLASSDVDIESIAAESGFGSTARFYASFGKLAGQTPAAYRRTIQAYRQ